MINLFFFKILLAFLFFCSLSLSCSKGSIDSPKGLEVLISGLKSKNPACICEPYINQYLWRNETVYVLVYKGPACDWFPTFYDVNGQAFTLQAGYTYDTLIQESDFKKTVWACR